MHKITTYPAAGVAAAALLAFAALGPAQDTPAPAVDEQPAAAQPAPQQPAGDEAAGSPAPAEASSTASNTIDERSYALGFVVGNGYGQRNIKLNPDEFIVGLKAGLSNEEPRIPEERLREILDAFSAELRDQQSAQMAALAQQGQQFLEANKGKEGVKTTESGLQYQVVNEGEGENPKPTDTVRVHYRGTLVDGTQFDSSYDRGEPAEFRLNEVIPGWTEALQLMKPGSKYRLVIPPDLAYGQEGRPPVIPPSSVLLFDVELLDILPNQ